MRKSYEDRPLTLIPIFAATAVMFAVRWLVDWVRPMGSPATPGSVREIDGLPLAQAFDGHRPVVFRGAAKRWPAYEEYHPQALRSTKADATVDSYVNEGARSFIQETARAVTLEYPTFIDAVFGDGDPERTYYSRDAADVAPLLGNLPEQVDGRPYSPTASSVWIGQAGAFTPLHNDPWHGLLIQVHGRKKVRMYAPEDYSKVYAKLPTDVASGYTELSDEHFDQDFEKFPKLATASPYDVVLEDGDILHIPMFWWHQVESLDSSISFVARYDPNYLEFLDASFFPQEVRGVLRLLEAYRLAKRQRRAS